MVNWCWSGLGTNRTVRYGKEFRLPACSTFSKRQTPLHWYCGLLPRPILSPPSPPPLALGAEFPSSYTFKNFSLSLLNRTGFTEHPNIGSDAAIRLVLDLCNRRRHKHTHQRGPLLLDLPVALSFHALFFRATQKRHVEVLRLPDGVHFYMVDRN